MKDWGGGSGKTHENDKWSGGAKPGNNEVARITTGTVTVQVAETFAALEFSGGTITGTNSITLSLATSSWTGGEVSGATVNLNGVSIGTNGANEKKLSNGAQMNLQSTTTWTGGNITTGTGSSIVNAGTFTTSFDGKVAHDSGTRATLTNTGTFTKSAGSGGATEIDATFNSSGTVNVSAGTLKLNGGGSSSGTVNLASGTNLQVTSNYTFSGGSLTGSGTVDVAGATTNFSGANGGAANLKVTGGTAKFNNSHSTTGSLTINSGAVDGLTSATASVGSFNWTAGDITTTNVVTGGSATISTTGNKKLMAGAQLALGGTTTWDGSTIATGGSAKLTNQAGGSFTATGDGLIAHNIDGNRATFTNNGTFTKSAGATGSTEIQATFQNAGTVNANAGRLKLTGGGSSAGAVSIGSGATVEIASDFSFGGGSISGTGKLELSSGITTFNGAMSGNSADYDAKGATVRFDSTHATSGKLSLSAGTVTGTSSATVGNLAWSGGDVVGTTLTASGATIGAGGAKRIVGGAQLNLAGSTTWSGDAIGTGSGAQLKNTGAFTTSFDGTIAHDQGGTRSTFKNDGSFTKSSASSGTTEIQTVFENSGTGAVSVQAGTLRLSGGGNSSGQVSVGAGAKLQVKDNDFAFNGGTLNGTGTGAIEISGAIATFANTTNGSANLAVNGGTARFNGAHSTSGKLSLSAGLVDGTNSATVGSLEWNGGDIAGATINAAGSTIGAGGAKRLTSGAKLNLSGNTVWSSDALNTGSGAEINNLGTFTTGFDGIIAHNQGGTRGTFKNQGSFTKSNATAGTTEVQASFDNTALGATVNVDGGTLRLSGGGNSSRNINVANGAKLQLKDSDFSFSGGVLNGAGTIEVNSAITSFSGTTGNANLSITGGTARLNGSHSTSGKLSLAAGLLDGASSATVGTLEWTGGDISAASVNANGASIGAGGSKRLVGGAKLNLSGNTSWSADMLNTGTGAEITNHGNFTTDFDGVLAHNQGGLRTLFKNHGTFLKTNGSGAATQIEARFENDGVVNVSAGKLHLKGGGRNGAAGSILVGAAAELAIDGDFDLTPGSSLHGNGLGRFLSGIFSANGNVGIKDFSFEGGGLAGSQTFTGNVDWKGGHWNSSVAGATTTIGHGAVLHLRGNSSNDFSNRSILNHGTVNWHSGHLRGGQGSVFTNEGLFHDLSAGNKTIGTQSGAASFTNNGEYRKTVGGTTTVEIPFTNNGGIKIVAGSMVFTGAFTNNGFIDLTNGATAQFSAPLSFGTSEVLSGNGVVTAPSVTAAGPVSPGVSPGMLTVAGNLSLLGTSSLLIEVGGPSQGVSYDLLNVGGNAALAGSLQVSFLNGYQWSVQPEQVFTVLTTANGLSGAFSNVAPGQRLFTFDGAGSFQVNYGINSMFSPNSVVLSNFVVAVPEPSTYAMLGAGALFVLFTVRRRK